LVLRTASIAEFEEMLLNGTIRDASTIAAWGLYKLWKERVARTTEGAKPGPFKPVRVKGKPAPKRSWRTGGEYL
jgi:hypothetical protein